MARVTTVEERVRMNELAQAGKSHMEIAEQLGWSQATVRKWCRRAQQGREQLASTMGRPRAGLLSSFPAAVRETLRAWRVAHPGWGAKTLHHQLRQETHFATHEVPSIAQIARFLHQERLTVPYERHHPLPESHKQRPSAPHVEWEMDAKGDMAVPEVGRIAFICLNDRYSHVRLACYPCWVGERYLERQPRREDYQVLLRLAFSEWGLPERLAVDNGTVFRDSASASPFPTRFHLWLVALGVQLVFGRRGRPTDQGMTERSPQLWVQQVVAGQHFASWQALDDALQARKSFLNERLPCTSLQQQPPLVACPEARLPRRLYRPEWKAELLDLTRVYHYLAQGRWFRTASINGTISLGGGVYAIGRRYARQPVEVTFDHTSQHVHFHAADGSAITYLPLQALTTHDLMGEVAPLLALPAFQLALPFTWEEWHLSRLSQTLHEPRSPHSSAVTTL